MSHPKGQKQHYNFWTGKMEGMMGGQSIRVINYWTIEGRPGDWSVHHCKYKTAEERPDEWSVHNGNY